MTKMTVILKKSRNEINAILVQLCEILMEITQESAIQGFFLIEIRKKNLFLNKKILKFSDALKN